MLSGKKLFSIVVMFVTLCVLSSDMLAQTIDSVTLTTAAGDKRLLKIWLPKDYHADKKYQTVYVFDASGQFDFVAAQVAYLSLYEADRIPPTIVVGVFYKNSCRCDMDELENPKVWNNPPLSKLRFTNYLVQDAIPYVQKHYNVSGFRVGIGHSFLANYMLYLLQNFPDVFSGYMAICPAPETSFPVDYEKLKVGRNKYLFLASAGYDMDERKAYADTLFKVLNTPAYKYLFVDHQLYNKGDHNYIYPYAMPDAFKFIFKDYCGQIALATAVYNESKNFKSVYSLFQHYDSLNRKTFDVGINCTAANFLTLLWATQEVDSMSFSRIMKWVEQEKYPSADLLLMLGEVQVMNFDNYKEGEALIKKGIAKNKAERLDPNATRNSYRVLFHNIYDEALHNPQLAWSTLQEAHQYIDDSPIWGYHEGVISAKYNYKVQEGIAGLKKYINAYDKQLDYPYSLDKAYYLLACCYNYSGNTKHAKEAVELSLQLNPQNEDSQKLKQKIFNSKE